MNDTEKILATADSYMKMYQPRPRSDPKPSSYTAKWARIRLALMEKRGGSLQRKPRKTKTNRKRPGHRGTPKMKRLYDRIKDRDYKSTDSGFFYYNSLLLDAEEE